jgi:hypothetical protein
MVDLGKLNKINKLRMFVNNKYVRLLDKRVNLKENNSNKITVYLVTSRHGHFGN